MENCAKNFVAAANGTKGGQVYQDIFLCGSVDFFGWEEDILIRVHPLLNGCPGERHAQFDPPWT
jgi:hypothetical protein